jgi:hypothetical protein
MERTRQTNLNTYFSNISDTEKLKQTLTDYKKENELLKSRIRYLEQKIIKLEIVSVNNNQSDDEDSSNQMEVDEEKPNKTAKKASYSMKFKYKAVLVYDELKDYQRTANEVGVHRASIMDWVKQIEAIMKQILSKKSTRLRLPGAGRELFDQEAEDFLVEWIQDQREKGFFISIKRFLLVAKSTFRDSNICFSYGWLSNFMCRNNFSYRKRTRNNYLDTNQIDDSVWRFFMDFYEYRTCNGEVDLIFNMDETR